MSERVAFTGERLHAGDGLFGLDLARHQAAYELAAERAGAGRTLDLGCGSGYGAASLAARLPCVVGLDRVLPDPGHRGRVHFVCGAIEALPLAPGSFELVTSFQVIEHLEDPLPYLDAIAALLAPGGTALVTTPNRAMSDGVNPYHVREYLAPELEELLLRRFAEVEVRGIGATQAVHEQLAARSLRIRRIMRLDPLGLRRLLPRSLLTWLFARFAVLVRRRGGPAPPVSWRDFPLGPADDRCLDLLAICRRPR